jgi:hypothetical protein
MARRGEPQAINQALNRPRAKLGLDLTAWMAISFVCIAIFLVGFRLLAMMAFPSLAIGMAHHSQTPKDVPTVGPEPQPEKLL